MKKEDLWKYFVSKNPDFEKTGANFTSKGLRKFFDTVYDQAYSESSTVQNKEYGDYLFNSLFKR
jgi:hypothetical protein